MGYNSKYSGEQVDNALARAETSAQQYYIQKALWKEGWYRIGLLTAIMSTSSAQIVVGGTNADVAPIIMYFQHNFRGNMLSQLPTVMTPLYVTKVRAVKMASDDVYIDLYFTAIASSLTTVSVFPLEGTWESMDFVDVTASAGGTVATEIDIVKDGFLDWKVDKVEGKGLSTEDFTTALKTKLERLNNYDDTAIEATVSKLREDFDALVSGDTTTAIKSFNDIVAFLDGISDSEDLDSIIASIEQQIASKMDKVTLASVATSGSYNDLSDQPTIPSAVTESTVSGWGFTKNNGTYTRPSSGIPKSDLESSVQASLDNADAALTSSNLTSILMSWTGYIGIGVGPNYKFHVGGSMAVNGTLVLRDNYNALILFQKADATRLGYIGMKQVDTPIFITSSATATYNLVHEGMTSLTLNSKKVIDASSNPIFYGTVNSSSDLNLKDVKGNVELSVSQIADAPSIYFTWKEGDNKQYVGTIAQYWKDVLPEVVNGEEGNFGIDYASLGVVNSIVLARKIREQDDTIKELVREIAEFKNKVS